MEQLIPVINKLQDVFNTIGAESLQLPQIAVVGSQSSGKSSVLESLVGRDFLPRGTGIVTRRPLVLQLVNRDAKGGFAEYGEFLHCAGKKFYDFDEICQEIIRETDRLSGSNKGISNVPINLKIYSPNVLNLTLVDLPGITKVPVGDQPEDIEKQIHDLVFAYIQNPNCIILAVTPANTDIANSDALKVARMADPEGNRTIGVCTKLDLMDQGTDAMDVLSGRVVPVKLGFIGVVNRSQQDIREKVSVQKARETEELYFRTHPVYAQVAARSGTTYLAKTLNKLLMHHIKECLPELKHRINAMLTAKQQQLALYGDPATENVDKSGLLLQVLTKVAATYCQIIDGTARDLATSELSGGARISYIFHETYGRTLDNADALDGLTVQDIRTAIRNATGARRALFVPEVSFEMLVKRQIQRLGDPSQRCAEMVHAELLRIASQCETMNELTRFGVLRKQITEAITELLNSRLEPTLGMIENLIGMELAYINTNHPDFVGGQQAVTQLMERRQQQKHTQVHAHPLVRPGAPAQKPRNHTLSSTMLPSGPTQGLSQSALQAYVSEQASLASERAKNASGLPPDDLADNPDGLDNPSTDSSQQRVGLWGKWFGGKTTTQAPSSNQEAPLHHVHSDNDLYDAGHFAPVDEELNSRDQMETDLIKSLITSYFNVVRKTVQDAVPKAVMFLLVNHIKDTLQSYLVSKLYKRENLELLLSESEEVVKQRKEAEEMYNALKRASAVLTQIRDTAIV